MADDRALAALRRLERALARIEAAADRPAPAPAPTASAASEDYARLKEAHDSLRRRVAGAIGQIDQLIDAEGAG